MVYSSYIQSLCMMSLVLLAFLKFENSDLGTKIKWTWKPIVGLKQITKYAHFLVLTLFFWLVLFSFWQLGDDPSYFLERLRIKVPFLLIPLSYIGLPRLSSVSFHRILYFFLVLMAISVGGVLINYAIHFEEVNILLKQGQHIATPCNHIKFSQLVALSILAGWYLWLEKFGNQDKHGLVVKALTVFLFLSIHILSVKTGLISLYLALAALVVLQIYKSRKLILGIATLSIIIGLPIMAYKYVPSFNKKVHYTLYDWQMYEEGRGSNYGDSGRLTSLEVAYDIFTSSPVFGVGAGNLKEEVIDRFETKHPQYEKPLMPHNQFLFVLAGSGVFGMVLFILALFIPLLYRRAFKNEFYLGFYVLFLISFLVEHTLENALGVGMFSSLLLLSLLYIHNPTLIRKTVER